MIKLRLTLFFIFQFLITTYSQNSSIKHFTTDDGLPSNNVFYVFFDSKGYMWLATDKGVAMYNGISFKIFTTYDGLPDNEVFGFNEDMEGRIWISTFKGVLCYYKDNVFHTALNTPWLKLSDKAPTFYGRFRSQNDSTVISEAADGLSVIVIRNERVKIIDVAHLGQLQIGKESSRSLLCRRINSNAYQIYYNRRAYIIDTFANIIKTISYNDTLMHSSCNSSHDDYVSTIKGIYSPEGVHLAKANIHNFDHFACRFVYFDKKGNSFITTSYGLLYNTDKLLLDSNYVTSVDHDNIDNIWVSTRENGIFCINKDFGSIYDARIESKIIGSKNAGDLTYLLSSKGDVYTLKNKVLQAGYIKGTGLKEDVFFDKTNTCITSEGDVFSFQNKSLFYKRKCDKSFKSIPIILDEGTQLGPPTKRITSLNGTFYVSLRESLFIIKSSELVKYKVVHSRKFPVYSASRGERIYYSAINPTDTTFWFSKVNEIFTIKNNIIKKQERLSNHTFRQFDFYKYYLVGSTDGNNLIIYDTKSGIIDSLPNANCIWQNIYKIDDNTAVINTNSYYRILRLYPPGEDGKPKFNLQTIESPFIPDQAEFIFGNGDMFYFIKKGTFSGFPNNVISAVTLPPKPLFSWLKTNKKTYAVRPVISISYAESKTVRIQIDNISFSDKNLITQYSISQNNEDNWNVITGNEINLNAVGYGKYTIKLRSKSISSVFSKQEILVLYVSKPFWAKWWFIVLSILAFLILLYGLIRLFIWKTVKKKQVEHDKEMKFQQAEYKALNALMNPHFIFNSLNSIQSLINKNKSQSANQYLVIFSKLIRQNMNNVSKGLISLYQELQLVENYLNLEKMRFKDLIEFSIDIAEGVDTEDVMIPPLLIQPLVENAIIHGLLPKQSLESHLRIKVYEIEDELFIDIIDNGIGIKQSLKEKSITHESYGLLNLNRRLEHLQQFQKTAIKFDIVEMNDTSGNVSGTRATLKITFDV